MQFPSLNVTSEPMKLTIVSFIGEISAWSCCKENTTGLWPMPLGWEPAGRLAKGKKKIRCLKADLETENKCGAVFSLLSLRNSNIQLRCLCSVKEQGHTGLTEHSQQTEILNGSDVSMEYHFKATIKWETTQKRVARAIGMAIHQKADLKKSHLGTQIFLIIIPLWILWKRRRCLT